MTCPRGQFLTLSRARLIASGFLVVASVFLVVSFVTAKDRQTLFGPSLGADYASYYVAGTILNRGTPGRLYDLQLQSRLYHELMPKASADEILPYPYAPFFGALLRPLASLPYEWSYVAWLVLGMAAYVTGFVLLWKAFPELGDKDLGSALIVAVAFAPFLIEGWIGGQSIGLMFLSVALAIRWHAEGRPLPAGFALAFLLLKPTMLVLILPMLMATRQVKVLAGFLLGSIAAIGLSLAVVGWQGCRGYVDLMLHYARVKDVAPDVLKTWKYVDLRSFMRLLVPGAQAWVSPIAILVTAVMLVLLVRVWWRVRGEWSSRHYLAWACALCWTPVLTLQCAIYDTTLIVPGVLLTVAALRRLNEGGHRREMATFLLLVALVYVVPWFYKAVALGTGVQLLTPAIVAMGVCQWRLARHATPHQPVGKAEAC